MEGSQIAHEKLAEAQYFRHWMNECVNVPVHFRYELSAFLTSARNVMIYLLKECKRRDCQNKNRDCRKWYDHQMGSNKTLKFFRCKRNLNIHDRPIESQQLVKLKAKETVVLEDSVSIIRSTDEDGKVVGPEAIEHAPSALVPTKIERTVDYLFSPGQENVLELCDMYVAELQVVLTEWDEK